MVRTVKQNQVKMKWANRQVTKFGAEGKKTLVKYQQVGNK